MNRKVTKTDKGHRLAVSDKGNAHSQDVCKESEEWEFEAIFLRLENELREMNEREYGG